MDRWSSGRLALVDDAGYSPGPAVGGGTSLAMVGAYVLADELARTGSNYQAGLSSYENRMRDVASRFRRIGPATMSTLIPRTCLQVRLTPPLLRLLIRMPERLQQRVSQLQATPARALESIHFTSPTAQH